MSQENLEVMHDVFDAFRRRDTARMFAAYHPDIEWNLTRYLPLPGAETIYRGREGIREFFRLWLADLTEYESKALDPLDWDDKVLITVYDTARGRESGVRIERYHAQIWTFRDGKVLRIELFENRDDALESAGVRPGDS